MPVKNEWQVICPGALRGLQWNEGEGIESSEGACGGAGYESKERLDMTNTQFLTEAVKKSGVAADAPVKQKALKFAPPAKNLESRATSLML